jgi:AcrR family transcriptional regulator
MVSTARKGSGARARPYAEDTRALLVDTAVQLWALRGVEAVSLREIGVAAGQKNTGVINYYFGDRDGLMQAVVERFAELHPDFEQRASAFLPTTASASTDEIAGALVRPLAMLLEEAPAYVQLIARFFADFGRSETLTALEASRWFARVEEVVQSRLGLDPHSTRWRFALTLAVHAVAEQARQLQRVNGPTPGTFVDDLTIAVAALLDPR